ncbi:hypothetical protein B484DRAFT_398673 [Ochromonadaceae sp. CCMP2298]|nr:hypothetical protein B484DRAFT_398673 [Ochromonadaceae sp. CCMP2298]
MDAVLLSEWEVDELLGPLRALQTGPCHLGPCLVNLAYLRQAADEGWAVPQPLMGASGQWARPLTQEIIALLLLAGLQLPAGETIFGTEARRQAVRELLPSPEARRAALHLPTMRGLQHMVSRSHLEAICAADIGEA